MDIYDHADYKEALRAIINDRRQQYGLKFTFEKMAKACGIQKTYLSKVLNGSGHLNADQLHSACDYLSMNDVQTEFILLIRESQLALNVNRKKKLIQKMDSIRQELMKTESNIKVSSLSLSNEQLWEFYTDFDLQLVLAFLTIPQFLSQPLKMTQFINITPNHLTSLLLKLENWGLIGYKNGKMELKEANMHLSMDSPIINSYRMIARLQAIEYLRKDKDLKDKHNNYSFSVLFSSDEGFQKKLRAKLLDLVKETHHHISKVKPDDVHLLNIDLLKWNIDRK